ncbi:MAG: leucine-rich repeat protein, partial [Dehalobacter sp.]|nr:leucine-rich repeat protein [Dehalobacter sp.]
MRKLTYKRMLHMLLAFLIAIGGLTTLDGITAMAAEGDVFTTDTAEGVTVTYKVLTEDTVNSTGTVQVGKGLAGETAIPPDYTGTVTIPSTVNHGGTTYTVVGIAYKAMYNCDLTSVNLPNTILSIGAYAFNATGITQIELPHSLLVIDGYAFAYCGSLTTVTVPQGVINIGGGAFNGCSTLNSAVLPDSITALPDYLFQDCTSLASVTLGSQVETIRYRTFYNCSVLTEITLPASLAEIRSDAFRDCSSLANIYFDGNAPNLSGTNQFNGVASPAYGNVYETAANFPFIGQDYYGLTIRQRGNNAQKPLITDLSSALAVSVGNGASLTVMASVLDEGILSFQWYENSVKQNTGGSPISGATGFSYVLPTDTAGVKYYYVTVTNTNTGVSGEQTAVTVSAPITVTVYETTDAETPVITAQPADTTVNQETVILSVNVEPLSDGGTLSYAWYENTADSYSGGVFVGEESSVIASYLGVRYYYVIVTNTNNSVSGDKTASVTSDIARVTIHPLINAQEPEITAQPQEQNVSVGDPVTLSATSISLDGGELSYQWYVNNFSSTSGATELPGSVQSSYSPSTSEFGTNYYFVVITNTNNDLSGIKSAQITSDIAMVNVSKTSYTITVENDSNGTAGANPNPAVAGQTVQLGYLADSGYQFKEWQVISGDINILPNNTFMMPASAVTVKAIFEDIPDYTISVSDDGHGNGSAEPAAADAGVTVTISAFNSPSYIFKEWQVISGGVTLASTTAMTTTFIMPDSNVEVKAIFENVTPGVYTLNLLSSTGGTVGCDGGSGLTSATNALVNLWTTPDTDYVFKEWELLSGTFDISNITKASDNWYQFMMPPSHLVLKAVFESTAPASYTVTFDANGGSGSMSDQTFTEGVAQTLTANAFTLMDYSFDGWATSPTGSVVYSEGQSVTISADTTLYAVWNATGPASYTVTFDANGGSGSMSDQTFTEGVAQTLTANAFTLTD